MAEPSITVVTGALVARILFERRRATGVEFRCDLYELFTSHGSIVVEEAGGRTQCNADSSRPMKPSVSSRRILVAEAIGSQD
jgi:hypothetical protein